VLKIDLLPKRFAIARKNKWILAIGIIFLVVVGAGFWVKAKAIRAEIVNVEATITKLEPIVAEVAKLETEISEKQSRLDPIKSKIDFVKQADETGEEYFDRFHSINKYIWAEAQMSSFSINSGGGIAGGMGGMMGPSTMGPAMRSGMTRPGAARTTQTSGGTASTVQFTVEVRGTAGVGRFLLNLLRCPDLTNITYSGIPGGRSIAATGAGVGTTGGVPGMPGPGMMGAGGMPPGRPGSGMTRPSAAPPMQGRGAPAGPPGMRGIAGPLGVGGGTSGAAGVEPGSPNEPISLQISATLTKPITTPTPPGGGMVAGGMGMPMAPGVSRPSGPMPTMTPGMSRPSGPMPTMPTSPGMTGPSGPMPTQPGGAPGAPRAAAPAAEEPSGGIGGIKAHKASVEE